MSNVGPRHDLEIRLVQPTDFDQWQALWDGYNAFYGRKDDTALPSAISGLTWSRFFDAYEPMHAFVAVRNKTLFGLAHILFHRSTISLDSVCYLRDLYTLESARGAGIGRALIEAACRYAANAGCSNFYWQTHETNATAMQLYDKVAQKTGFVVYSKTL